MDTWNPNEAAPKPVTTSLPKPAFTMDSIKAAKTAIKTGKGITLNKNESISFGDRGQWSLASK